MKQYEQFQDYVLFEQIESDFVGDNFRAGRIVNRKVKEHVVISRVHPYLSEDITIWNRIKILLEGVKKSNIPHLYSPDRIEQVEKVPFLQYPFLKARSFEKVVNDAHQKEIPINFDLALSIAISVAELIDMGSSIIVSGQRSYHGFLTPDNILIDSDGKIFLKNYGIAAYLNNSGTFYDSLTKKYGTLLTPEFLKKDKLTAQSDIYHLGFLVYKMLTGSYFSYIQGEDFDAKFANISFSSYVPTTDKDFLTSIITFFKKTLNPDPTHRFANIKEFKDFISRYFHIEELSSVTFNLAYFINSIYDEEDETMAKRYQQELGYEIPEEKKPESARQDDNRHLVEDILTGLDNQEKSSKGKWIGIAAAAVIVIAVIIFMVMQNKSATEAAQKALEAQRQQSQQQIEQLKNDQIAAQTRLDELMNRQTQTEAEQKQKEALIATQKREMDRIAESRKVEEKKQIDLDAQKAVDKVKESVAAAEEQKRQEDARKALEVEEQKKRDEAARLEEEKRNRVPQIGELLELADVDIQPKKTKGEAPQKFNSEVRKAMKGKTIRVEVRLLIDEKGGIVKTMVLPKELDPMLRQDISFAISVWTFEPAKKKNIAVKVWIIQSFELTF